MATQLKPESRGVITQRLEAGVHQKQIAKELECHPRTIGRELQRNRIAGI